MNPKQRNKERRTYTLSKETLELLKRMSRLFFAGNASATVERAIRELARQYGLAVILTTAMKRRQRRVNDDEEEEEGHVPVMAPEEVFWGLLAWGKETFGDAFFEATYAVDPKRGPHGTFSWSFSFDLAAYERLRGQGQERDCCVEKSKPESVDFVARKTGYGDNPYAPPGHRGQ